MFSVLCAVLIIVVIIITLGSVMAAMVLVLRFCYLASLCSRCVYSVLLCPKLWVPMFCLLVFVKFTCLEFC